MKQTILEAYKQQMENENAIEQLKQKVQYYEQQLADLNPKWIEYSIMGRVATPIAWFVDEPNKKFGIYISSRTTNDGTRDVKSFTVSISAFGKKIWEGFDIEQSDEFFNDEFINDSKQLLDQLYDEMAPIENQLKLAKKSNDIDLAKQLSNQKNSIIKNARSEFKQQYK